MIKEFSSISQPIAVLVYILRQINLSVVTYLLYKECELLEMESKNRPCVWTVQDRQGRPLLVLVLHVQKYKPLHCSQHAGGVSGQKAENTVETGLILFLFLLVLAPYFPSSPPKQICCLGRCFPVYLPLKHLEMHRHTPTHAHTNVVAPVLSEGDCQLLRELIT